MNVTFICIQIHAEDQLPKAELLGQGIYAFNVYIYIYKERERVFQSQIFAYILYVISRSEMCMTTWLKLNCIFYALYVFIFPG